MKDALLVLGGVVVGYLVLSKFLGLPANFLPTLAAQQTAVAAKKDYLDTAGNLHHYDAASGTWVSPGSI